MARHRTMLAACFALGASLAVLPGRAESQGPVPAPPKLPASPASVDLPFGDAMFSGPGSDPVNSNCLACHSADMVLNQPALSKAAWDAEVQKMIGVYKAPVAPGDVPAILAYLDSIKSAEPPATTTQPR